MHLSLDKYDQKYPLQFVLRNLFHQFLDPISCKNKIPFLQHSKFQNSKIPFHFAKKQNRLTLAVENNNLMIDFFLEEEEVALVVVVVVVFVFCSCCWCGCCFFWFCCCCCCCSGCKVSFYVSFLLIHEYESEHYHHSLDWLLMKKLHEEIVLIFFCNFSTLECGSVDDIFLFAFLSGKTKTKNTFHFENTKNFFGWCVFCNKIYFHPFFFWYKFIHTNLSCRILWCCCIWCRNLWWILCYWWWWTKLLSFLLSQKFQKFSQKRHFLHILILIFLLYKILIDLECLYTHKIKKNG